MWAPPPLPSASAAYARRENPLHRGKVHTSRICLSLLSPAGSAMAPEADPASSPSNFMWSLRLSSDPNCASTTSCWLSSAQSPYTSVLAAFARLSVTLDNCATARQSQEPPGSGQTHQVGLGGTLRFKHILCATGPRPGRSTAHSEVWQECMHAIDGDAATSRAQPSSTPVGIGNKCITSQKKLFCYCCASSRTVCARNHSRVDRQRFGCSVPAANGYAHTPLALSKAYERCMPRLQLAHACIYVSAAAGVWVFATVAPVAICMLRPDLSTCAARMTLAWCQQCCTANLSASGAHHDENPTSLPCAALSAICPA